MNSGKESVDTIKVLNILTPLKTRVISKPLPVLLTESILGKMATDRELRILTEPKRQMILVIWLSTETTQQSMDSVNSRFLHVWYMSLNMRKPAFRICENKDADQFRGDREADQRLCFRYTYSTIPLLPKSEISSL